MNAQTGMDYLCFFKPSPSGETNPVKKTSYLVFESPQYLAHSFELFCLILTEALPIYMELDFVFMDQRNCFLIFMDEAKLEFWILP